jgi:hypothetical protein
MFKIFFTTCSLRGRGLEWRGANPSSKAGTCKGRMRRDLKGAGLAILAAGSLGVTGCRTVPALPPIDLKSPGWMVQHGQAVWRSRREAAEIAGELLVARDGAGQGFIQFTKEPFPIAVARWRKDAWQLEFPAENRRYAGHKPAPARTVWLLLGPALDGKPPPKPWAWQQETERWHLGNNETGESLEGYLEP